MCACECGWTHTCLYICICKSTCCYVEISLVLFFLSIRMILPSVSPSLCTSKHWRGKQARNSWCWPVRVLGHWERQMNLLGQCWGCFGEGGLAVAQWTLRKTLSFLDGFPRHQRWWCRLYKQKFWRASSLYEYFPPCLQQLSKMWPTCLNYNYFCWNRASDQNNETICVMSYV